MRIFKHFTFGADDPSTSVQISFSSYAGMISSTDDFYEVKKKGSAIVIIETTINVLDKDSYKWVKPDHGVPTWIRAMDANRLAMSGKEWVERFKQDPSETYSCQWMVIDLAKFVPGQRPTEGLLYVFESFPKIDQTIDATSTLVERGWWHSENNPALPKVRSVGRYPDTTGDSCEEDCSCNYSAEHSSRACIFNREAKAVEGVKSMMALIRMNDYKHDEYSHGDPYKAICGRFDLRSGKKLYNGAIDAKVSSYCLMAAGDKGVEEGGSCAKAASTDDLTMTTLVVGGPTADGDDLPSFSWPHAEGLPVHQGTSEGLHEGWFETKP